MCTSDLLITSFKNTIIVAPFETNALYRDESDDGVHVEPKPSKAASKHESFALHQSTFQPLGL